MAFAAITRFIATFLTAAKPTGLPQKEPIAWGLLTASAPIRYPH